MTHQILAKVDDPVGHFSLFHEGGCEDEERDRGQDKAVRRRRKHMADHQPGNVVQINIDRRNHQKRETHRDVQEDQDQEKAEQYQYLHATSVLPTWVQASRLLLETCTICLSSSITRSQWREYP